MENILFDVIVKGLFRNPQFRMVGDDLIGGVTLFQQGSDDGSHSFGFLYCQIYPFPGARQSGSVIMMCLFRRIPILVESAMGPVGAAITGTGGAISSGTAEGAVIGTVESTLSAVETFTVMNAFQRESAFIGEDPMKFDLFSDSGLVFTDGLSNGRFGRAVSDAGEDDASFIQSQM